jgi:hypothetical protein
MLFYYLAYTKYFCIGALLVSLLLSACAVYAYSVNWQRAADDPEKKDFHAGARILVFFTWPVLIPIVVSLFVVRALVYGLFLIIFAALVSLLPRESHEPSRLEKRITKIGDALLEANSFLIKLLLRPWEREPESI